MKGLSLEQFKSELEGDAQKRCEAQAKTIAEQENLIKCLREQITFLRRENVRLSDPDFMCTILMTNIADNFINMSPGTKGV